MLHIIQEYFKKNDYFTAIFTKMITVGIRKTIIIGNKETNMIMWTFYGHYACVPLKGAKRGLF